MNEYKLDVAVESGDFETTKHLILEHHLCPSLYAVQQSFIQGNARTGNFALAHCFNTLRSGTDLKKVHYNYKTNKWNECIPENYRY